MSDILRFIYPYTGKYHKNPLGKFEKIKKPCSTRLPIPNLLFSLWLSTSLAHLQLVVLWPSSGAYKVVIC